MFFRYSSFGNFESLNGKYRNRQRLVAVTPVKNKKVSSFL